MYELFVCMSSFSGHMLSCFPSIVYYTCPFPPVYVCVCTYRCMRLCHATVNAANTSGGPSPGPFVPSTLWTTCLPVGRESKAARSGQ